MKMRYLVMHNPRRVRFDAALPVLTVDQFSSASHPAWMSRVIPTPHPPLNKATI
jgi:hypothetical protein